MTAYSFNLPQGQAGQIADATLRRIETKHLTAGVIEFGVALAQSLVTANEVLPWTGVAMGPVVGISVYSATQIRTVTKVGGNYEGPTDVSVLTFGRIFVVPSVVVSVGDKAYLVEGTGAFTNVAAGNHYVGIYTKEGIPNNPSDNLAVLNFDLEVTY